MKDILIIDDEKDFCYFIKDALEATGKYRVAVVNESKDAIQATHKLKPDLILLDINMPEISGFEVLKALKDDERTVATPVIMLTVKDDAESKQKAAKLYNEGYLVKPVEIKTLRDTIAQVLSRRCVENRAL